MLQVDVPDIRFSERLSLLAQRTAPIVVDTANAVDRRGAVGS